MSEEKDTMRKKFKRKVMVGVGFLLALGGGAFAAILISALMTGTLTTVAKPTMEFTGTQRVVSTDGSGIACAPTLSNGKMKVDITNAMPGSSCTVSSGVMPSADGLKVQDVTFGNLDVEFVQSGTSPISCGYALDDYLTQNAVLKLTVPQDAPVGTSAITGQLDAVPSAQYDPALCSN